MGRIAKKSGLSGASTAHAERVGAAEFRGNLAKYLKHARSGKAVVIQERGRSVYLLVKLDEATAPSVFGCMRDRTRYTRGTIVNADEDWSSGTLP